MTTNAIKFFSSHLSEFFMPGLVDTHIHAPQYYFAGSNLDLPLLEWLTTYTYPTELRFQSIDFTEEVYTKVVVSTLCVSVGVLCLVTWRNVHFLGQILSIQRTVKARWTIEISLVLSSEFVSISPTQLVTSKERT